MNTPDSRRKNALVFLNLGTPADFTESEVRRYLREFLMDPYVINFPYFARWLLVYGLIIPFRVKRVSKAYRKIWMEEGSPLKVYSERLVGRLQEKLNPNQVSGDELVSVSLAMRYGQPSIAHTFGQLVSEGFNRISVFTAYPQYATSSTFTAHVACRRALESANFKGEFRFIESYETEPHIVAGWVEKIRSQIQSFKPDHVLFSYHGLPIQHLKQISADCVTPNCCDQYTNERRLCYRRQCYATTRELVAQLGLSAEQYSVGFQSRLSDKWIKPYSDDYYRDLPRRGIKRLLVACPSFTVDCLETVEEVALRGRNEFRKNGGEDLQLVPALNDSDAFARAIASIYGDESLWQKEIFGG